MINGLPEKLKALRIKNGFSQRNVAERLEISPSIVSGYETGERTPSVEILLSLAYLYKSSTDYLLGRRSDDPSNTLSADGLTDEQIQAIVGLIRVMRKQNPQ